MGDWHLKFNLRKKARFKAIEEIVRNNEISKQGVLISLLKKEYGIKVNQATISRSLDALKITKDKKTGFYVLSDQVEKGHLKKKLMKALIESDCTYVEERLVPLIFQCNPAYVPIVCTLFENYYEKEGQIIGAIPGPTGTILLFVPEKEEKKIKKELDSFSPH